MSNAGFPSDHDARLGRALVGLEGLSVGDAFGQRFFAHPAAVAGLIRMRATPAPPWPYTDDTMMALSVVETLRLHGGIDPDHLASGFARGYDPARGYGPAMHDLLPRLLAGEPWHEASPGLFGGRGSFGNGAAMRVAPVGAYFADDLDAVVEQARRSAMVTHAHAEGVAGAVAVAVAAAWAWRLRDSVPPPDAPGLIDLILPHVPEGAVRGGILRARDLAVGTSAPEAVAALGNGSRVTAQDTVPFTLWCAGRSLGDYEEALWLTVGGLGDRDTTCAIVGGIVAMFAGVEAIPEEWLNSREPLPGWATEPPG